MKNIVCIGLDDTDILGEAPGTGRVARELAKHLENLGLGKSLGVSRHQLLVDPRIPYTSHNSSLCVGMQTDENIATFNKPCTDYVISWAKQGSDPGLCLLAASDVKKELVEFGWRATREVLTKQEAINLASKYSLVLKELGGTGGGIIGALSACVLRADGNQGRFVELRGIRQITGIVSAGEIKARTAIEAVYNPGGELLDDSQRIESYGWIRPSLQDGRIVLRVQPVASNEGSLLWEPVENRKDKPKKKQEACE